MIKIFNLKNGKITSFDASTISNEVNVVNFSNCGRLTTIENLHLLPASVTSFNFSWCRSLGELPELPPQIKDLFLKNQRGLIKIENPFSPNLTNIDLSGCLALKELPKFPPNLICLNLSGCRSIESLQHPLPESLTTINFASCKSLTTMPNLHEGVTSVNLYNCLRLKKIEYLPNTLISLHLHHFKGLIKSLPPLLESLIFSGHKCKELPFILTDKITELDLDNCKNLEILPDDLPEGLKKLNLTDCRNLKSLPDSLSSLDNLKILKLKYCLSLTELPSLPEALEELDLSNCKSLTKLPKPLPRNLKILNLSGWGSLTELPDPLPEGLEKLDLSGCESLTKLPDPLPKNLKILNLHGCESLTELPDPLPEGLEGLDFSYCEKLTHLPESISKLRNLEIINFRNCESLKEFPVNYHFPNDLKKLNLSGCKSLTELPDPLPKNLKELNLSSCESLTKLPDPLPEGLKILILSYCKNLTHLPESILKLDKLENLDLSLCDNLSVENINLLRELEKKHAEAGNFRFQIRWPEHFVNPLISSCYDLLDQAYLEVNKDNGDAPIYSDKSTLKLFKRFTSENIIQRGNTEEIYDHAKKVAKAIKDHPYVLDVLENNSIHYLKACINQPVMGFVKTAILTDFAVEQDISSKLNIAKRMAIIATIEQEILSLKSQSGEVVGEGVQIELGNAMLREIYNQNKESIEDKTGGAWKGISKGITCEQIIRRFLTDENIAKVWHKVDNVLRDLSDINKAREYIAEASLNGIHKDFAMIFLGKEEFDERQKELKTLKAQYLEIEDHLSSSAVEISNKIQQIERGENLKEKVDNKIRELSHESDEGRGSKRQRREEPGTNPGGPSILGSEMRLR